MNISVVTTDTVLDRASGFPLPLDYAAAPRIRDRLPAWIKTIYGASGMVNYFGGQLLKVLSASIFVAGMGISPAWIGIIFLLFRLWDGMVDPLIGWLSDNTRTRWGRRRPYVLVGGIFTGLLFPLLWIGQPDWSEAWKVGWLLGIGLIFYTAFSFWVIPYQSMMLEMTPDTNERTSISAYVALFGKFASIIGTWVWTLTQLSIFADPVTGQPDSLHGMRIIGLALGLLILMLSIMPAFVVKERDPEFTARQPKTPFWATMFATFANRPFRLLALYALIFSFGINLVQGQMFYLRTYYTLKADTVLASKMIGIEGTGSMILGIVSIPLFTWLCKKIGKKQTLIASTIVILLATWLSWFTYTPAHPWWSLATGLMLTPGYTGMWLVLPSMLGDVTDDDELHSGKRREGSFNSVFSWLTKLSTSLAYGLAGVVVVACGFVIAKKADQSPEAFWNMRFCFATLPTLFLGPALYLLWQYKLSGKRMEEIRAQIDARHRAMDATRLEPIQ